MNHSGDSLRGKNESRRAAGVGSTPTLPTKSVRTRLWQQLRKLDSEMFRLKSPTYMFYVKDCDFIIKVNEKLKRADQKRIEIRNKLKGYKS